MKRSVLSAVVLLAVCLLGSAVFAQDKEPRVLKMATTTSTENSGLLEHLLPAFEKEYNTDVRVIAVGTGRALKLAENGDVDVVMVHAPDAEKRFVEKGYGVNRTPFMKNDFVILGPPSDPAGVKDAKGLSEALRLIKDKEGAVFVSRGDESGTHKKEKKLWKLVSGPPEDDYLETGQGMGASLRIADERRAYILCDRGTFLALQKNFALDIVFEGAPRLDNRYSIIAVNPERWPEANNEDAIHLAEWLTTPAAQKLIHEYRVKGEILFHPTVVPPAELKKEKAESGEVGKEK
ncbi:MAG: substrate-binding domain-containing protein [bacterium]